MSSIDRRIVEMQFENGQFEKGIDESIKSLDKLKNGLNLEKAVTSIESSVSSIAEKFNSLGARIKYDVIDKAANYIISKGEQIVNSISVDQIYAGMSKYEMMTKAVQTIKSATGQSVEVINDYLADLNKYTDETSYDFADMANNIGKFTSNGVELGQAVTAMKGIGNEAAKSGAGISEASRAMYNFSQALATGKVRVMDWMSIENANMATKEFKETIIETAKEVGTLNKEGKTAKGTLVTFKSFRDTLQEDWFTNDVLIKTLEKYADTTTDFGLEAFHAAQQAITFSDALNAVKDSVSSGWMHTFQILFGDLQESIDLWTNLCNAVIEAIAPISEFRNEVLQGWKDLGGRDDLIKGLSDAFTGLWNIIRYVVKGIQEIFPPVTAERLKDFSDGVKELGHNIKMAFFEWETTGGVEEVINEVENPDAITRNLEKGLEGVDVKKLQEKLMALGYELPKFGADGIFGSETENAVKQLQKDLGLIEDGIIDISNIDLLKRLGLGETITEVERVTEGTTNFSDALLTVKNIASGVGAAFSIAFKGLKFIWGLAKSVLDVFSPLGNVVVSLVESFSLWLVGIDKAIADSGKLESWVVSFGESLKPVKDWIQSLSDSILEFFGLGHEMDGKQSGFSSAIENIKTLFSDGFDKIKEIFSNFGDWLIELSSSIDSLGIIALITGIASAGFIATIIGAVMSFKKLLKSIRGVVDSIQNIFQFNKKKNDIGKTILEVAGAIALLVASVYVLSKIDTASLIKGLLALASIFVILSGGLWVLGKVAKGISKDAKGVFGSLVSVALSIGILSACVVVLGNMDIQDLGKGLAALAVVMLELSGFLFLLSKIKISPKALLSLLPTVIALTVLVASFVILSVAIKHMSTEDLVKSLISFGALMAELAGFLFLLGLVKPNIKAMIALIPVAASLMVLTVSFIALALTMKLLSTEELIESLISFGVLMAELAGFMFLLGLVKPNIKAMIALVPVAASLMVLTVSFIALALTMKLLSTEDLIKSLIAFGVLMAELAGFMFLLGLVKPNVKAMVALLPVAASLMLLTISFVALSLTMKLLSTEDLIKSLIAFGGLMLGLSGFLFLLGLVKPNIKAMVALLPVAAALTLMTLSFIGLALVMRNLSTEALIKSLASFAVISAALVGITFILGKTKVSIKSTLSFLVLAAALSLLAIAFSLAANHLKSVPWETLLAFGASLALVIAAMAIVTTVASKVPGILKGLLAMLPMMIALGLAMAGLVIALHYVKDIDANKIIAFSTGLSTVLLALSAAGAIARIAGLGGILGLVGIILGVAAAIGLIAAAFGAIDKIPGARDFLNNGAKFFGELIANFLDPIVNVFTKGITEFSAALDHIASTSFEDPSKIDMIIGYLDMISKMCGAFPTSFTISGAVATFIAGTPFQQFVNSLTPLAYGLLSLNGALSIVSSVGKIDEAKVGILMDGVTELSELALSFPTSFTIKEAVATALVGTPYERFIESLAPLSLGIIGLSTAYSAISGVTLSEGNINILMDGVTQLADLARNFPDSFDIKEAVATALVGTPYDNFVNSMVPISVGILALSMAYSAVSGATIDAAKVNLMMDGLNQLATLAGNFPDSFEIKDAIATIIADTPYERFVDSLPKIGAGIMKLSIAMSLISGLSLDESKIEIMTSSLTTLSELSTSMDADYTFSDAIADWLNGGSPFENFIDNLPTLAREVSDFSDDVVNDTNINVGFLMKSVLIRKSLGEIVSLMEDVEEADIPSKKTASVESFIGYAKSLGGMISDYALAIKDVEGTNIVSNSIKVRMALSAIVDLFESVSEEGAGSISSAYDEIGSFILLLEDLIAAFEPIGKEDSFDTEAIEKITGFMHKLELALMYIDSLAEAGVTSESVASEIKSAIKEICGIFTDDSLTIDPQPLQDFAESIKTIFSSFNQNGSFTEVGETFGQDIVTGISNQNSNGIAAAQNLATAIIRSANAYFTSAKFQMKTNGQNLINGLVTGMNNNSGFAVAAMKKICENVVQTARNILKINSPSKVFAEIGGGIPEGMAKGIDEMAYLSDKSVEDLGNGAINTFRTIVNDISNAIDSGIDTTPVIRPVIDMSDVYSNAGTISSLFSSRKTMSIAGNVQASLDKIKAPVVNIDRGASNSNVVAAINDMNTRFDTLNQRIDNLQIVLDSGSVVGGIAEKMDKQLGTFAVRKGRGN